MLTRYHVMRMTEHTYAVIQPSRDFGFVLFEFADNVRFSNSIDALGHAAELENKHKMSRFPNYPTKQAPPPSAIRGRDHDYARLDDVDRRWLDNVLDHDYNKTIVPRRVQEFIRRYHPGV